MRKQFGNLLLALIIMASFMMPIGVQPGKAQEPSPGEPVVLGNPDLTSTVVVFPYDVDIFGIYLVTGNNMQPVTSVPVEHINLDRVTAKLSPDGYKVAYLVSYGSTGFNKLVIVGSNGLNSQTLFESDHPDKYITTFEWSHDSNKVAFSLSADQSVFPADLTPSFTNPDLEINPLDETVLPQAETLYTGEVWAADINTKDTYQLVDSGAQNILGWTSSDAGIIFSQHSTQPTVADDSAVEALSPVPVPETMPAGVSVVSSSAVNTNSLNNLLQFPVPTDENSKIYYDVKLLEDASGTQKLAALSAVGDFESGPQGPTTLEVAALAPDTSPSILSTLSLTEILTSDSAISSLSISPNGQQIAFATEDNSLWKAGIDGSEKAVVLSSGVDDTASIHWNAASTGLTAQDLTGDTLDVLALDGGPQGSLAAIQADALANPDPASLADVRNYSAPFIHQLWDTPDAFNGRCACGPTSTAMALAAYQKLSPHPITVNSPSAHTSNFGWYVSEDFSGFTDSLDPGGCPRSNGGLYGTIVRNGGAGREYIQIATKRFGIDSTFAVYQSTFDIVKSALDRGHLVILSTDLTGAGHIILVKGYTNDNKIIVNDPWGNAFGGTYGQRVIDGADKYYPWSQVKPKWYLEVQGTFPSNPNPNPPPVPPVITHWKGEYYNNTGLSGSPALVRNDTDINFNWGGGSPSSSVNSDNFSARWTRSLYFERGSYRFTAGADDGVRLWVDNQLRIDAWRDQGFTNYSSGDIFLDGGTHSIKMEYYERGGDASAKLSWNKISTGSGGADWYGEYYNNRTLSGSPAFTRNDSSVYFNWGTGRPDSRVGYDNFSARWTKTMNVPRSGIYRIYVRSDDGVRVWVDGQLRIDAWRDQAPTTHVSNWLNLSAGNHTIKVEYYENGGGAFIHLNMETAFYAEFFKNRSLSGSPASTGYYNGVYFNWGSNGPVGVRDNFSARFTGQLSLSGGNYTFCTRTDDGVRLYVDGSLVINQWRDMGTTTYCAIRSLSKGFHEIKMEYYENGGGAYAQLWWDKQSGVNALAAMESASLSADDIGTTEADIMALYNDHGYLGALQEGDLGTVLNPTIYLPVIVR